MDLIRGNNKPRGYINWVLFDEQFKFVQDSNSAQQMPDERVFGATPNQQVYPIVSDNLPIDKNG